MAPEQVGAMRLGDNKSALLGGPASSAHRKNDPQSPSGYGRNYDNHGAEYAGRETTDAFIEVINGSELESGRAARCLFTQREMSAMAPNATGRYRIVSRASGSGFYRYPARWHILSAPAAAQLWLNQAKVTATSDLIQLARAMRSR